MGTQNFQNHSFFPKWFVAQLVTGVLALLIIAAAAVKHEASWAFVAMAIGGILLAVTVQLMNLNVRYTALQLQDRIIRLEMQVRLYRLLPQELHARIPELTVAQLVSLRFASDAELAELTATVLRDNITERAAIKKMVKNWQADDMRV
jgi:energy-coupling factor transporter transmembrane protein EcfT